jgi:hypothetical protein
MKPVIAWLIISVALAAFWGLSALALSGDIDTAIIVGGAAFFGATIVSGFAVSAARRLDNGR